MPWKDGEFQWDRDEKYADLLQGRYGHEHDELLADLVNLENGIRKYWADKLRTVAGASLDATERHTYHDAANLLDPYHQRGDRAGWEATNLDDGNGDGAVGSRWVKPV